MKYSKKNELDVDFIGGQGSLTKEEEKAISDYINSKKVQEKMLMIRKKRTIKREKSAV